MSSWMSEMILESAGQWLKSLAWDVAGALGWGGILAVLAGFALMIALSTKALKCLTSWWGATAAAILLVVGLYFMGMGGGSPPALPSWTPKPVADRLAKAIPALPELSLPDIYDLEDEEEEESPASKQEKANDAALAVVDALAEFAPAPEMMLPIMPSVVTSHPFPSARVASPPHVIPHVAAGVAHATTHPPVVSALAAAGHAQPSTAPHPGGMQSATAHPSAKTATSGTTVQAAPSSKPALPGGSNPPVAQAHRPNRRASGNGPMAGGGLFPGFAQGGSHMAAPQPLHSQGGGMHGGLTHKQTIHQQNLMAGQAMDRMMGQMLSGMDVHPSMHPMAPHAGMMPGGMGHMGGGHPAAMHHAGH